MPATGKLLLPLLLWILPGILSAQYTEAEIKAVFLEKFTRFISWPEESTVRDSAYPFILGIAGSGPIVPILENVYANQEIKNKPVEIIHISNPADAERCSLVFITGSAEPGLGDILDVTRGRPILTVSDSPGFARKGVNINMYLDKGRIRYEINEAALKNARFTASYRLLANAKIVNPVESYE